MKKLLLFILLFPITLAAQTVNGSVTLSATASDPVIVGATSCGIKDVQFFSGSNPLSPLFTTPNSGTNYTFVWNTTKVTNGTYTITAKATDKAGSSTDPTKVCDGSKPNTGTSNALTVVINNAQPDITGPVINITIVISVGP
jgi:hypothetical protein